MGAVARPYNPTNFLKCVNATTASATSADTAICANWKADVFGSTEVNLAAYRCNMTFFAVSVRRSITIFFIHSSAPGPAFSSSFLKRLAANGVAGVSFRRSSRLPFRSSLSLKLNLSKSSAYIRAACKALDVHGNASPHSPQNFGGTYEEIASDPRMWPLIGALQSGQLVSVSAP